MQGKQKLYFRASVILSVLSILVVAIVVPLGQRSSFSYLLISVPAGIVAIIFARLSRKPIAIVFAIFAAVFPAVYPFMVMAILAAIYFVTGGRYPAGDSWL